MGSTFVTNTVYYPFVSRTRKTVLVLLGILGLVICLGAAAFCFPSVRIEYHKSRLVAAKKWHARLVQYGPSTWEEFWGALRGTPYSSDEAWNRWQNHEDALIALGFLSRREYVVTNNYQPTRHDPAFNAALMEMETNCPWWSCSIVGARDKLIVAACARGMQRWEKLAPKFGMVQDGTPQAHRGN